MASLKTLDPANVATRAFQLMGKYRDEHDLPERRAMACAIGELLMEADDIKARAEIDFAPPESHGIRGQRSGLGRLCAEGGKMSHEQSLLRLARENANLRAELEAKDEQIQTLAEHAQGLTDSLEWFVCGIPEREAS